MLKAMFVYPVQADTAWQREYEERIRNVEHADFNPLVFTTAGGMGPQSHLVIKRLAATLSEKKDILGLLFPVGSDAGSVSLSCARPC